MADNDATDNQMKPTADDFAREVVDRRAGTDRRRRDREESGYGGPERRAGDRRTGLERRRGAGIRREADRRSAEEGEMTPEQFEFVKAIESFKKRLNKPFPTWVDVLGVVVRLGYRSVAKKTIRLADEAATPSYVGDAALLDATQVEFVRAVETYKRVNAVRFPTWTEVLEVVEQLGYRKVQRREIELADVPEPDLVKVA